MKKKQTNTQSAEWSQKASFASGFNSKNKTREVAAPHLQEDKNVWDHPLYERKISYSSIHVPPFWRCNLKEKGKNEHAVSESVFF